MPHVPGSTPGVGTVFESRLWVVNKTKGAKGGSGLRRASDAVRPLSISRAQRASPEGVQ